MTAPSLPPATAAPATVRDAGSGRLREIEALVHLLGPHRRDALIGVATTIAGSLVYLVTPYLTKVLIDQGVEAGSKAVVVGTAVASVVLVATSWVLRRVRIRVSPPRPTPWS